MHRFIICVVSLLSLFTKITNRKQRSLTPYSKLEESIRWTSLRKLIWDNGSSRASKFCCPPNMRETKRESREARSGYRITCPRGIWGWRAYEDRDRTRAIERWGIPQDVDAERTSISRLQLSLSLAQYFLFETFFTLKLKPLLHAFLSSCTTSSVPWARFSSQYSFITKYCKFYFLQIYIKIWHTRFIKNAKLLTKVRLC
jgi:hypothetical protein